MGSIAPWVPSPHFNPNIQFSWVPSPHFNPNQLCTNLQSIFQTLPPFMVHTSVLSSSASQISILKAHPCFKGVGGWDRLARVSIGSFTSLSLPLHSLNAWLSLAIHVPNHELFSHRFHLKRWCSTFIPSHRNHRTQRWTIPCEIFCTTVKFIPHDCLTSFCFLFMLIFILTTHDPVFSISYSHSRGIFLSFLSADRHHTHVQSYSICSSFIRWHMRWFVPCHALGSMNNHNAYLYEWSTSSMHEIFWSFINAPNFLMHIITHP